MRRNVDSDNHHSAASCGPLMTDHLHDLDIELELLKRKREIIQQEQDILNRFTTKRQYDYAHSSNTYNRQGYSDHELNTNNYSYRQSGPSSSGNFSRPPTVKRQTPSQYWPSPSAPKRYVGPQKLEPWPITSHVPQSGLPTRNNFPPPLGTISSQIRPLMSLRPSIGERIQKKVPIQRKDFKPSKVTKPKAQLAPSKPITIPLDIETKKLVTPVVDTVSKKAEYKQILRVDKTPTVQMNGRLELALGTIMKEVKKECCDPNDTEYIQSPLTQRMLKHIIRTRIRSVMIDQVVGSFNDIVLQYRQKFPKETDIDLVQIAKAAQKLSSKSVGVAQLIESDDLQEFYSRNISKMLLIKLEELFGNMEKVYLQKAKDLNELITDIPEPKTVNDVDDNTQAKSKEYKRNDRIDLESIVGTENVIEAMNEKLSKVKFYKDFMDELIEQRLPRLLPKFKDQILSIIHTDKEFLTTKAMVTSQLKRRVTKSFQEEQAKKLKNATPQPETTPAPETASKSQTPENTSASEPSDTQAELTDDSSTTTPTKTNAKTTPETPKTNAKTTPETPKMNAKTTPETPKTNANTTPQTPKTNAITTPQTPKTNAITTPQTPKTNANTTPETPKASTEQNNPITNTPKSDELLYVKLISRPSLPSRAVIYEFLNKFKPTSIKKHKSINNLLVIAFANREDYDRILTGNETKIGDATITIKASEQANKTNQSTPSQGQINESMKSDDSLLGSDIENQISDLLTSIRKANEPEESTNVNNSEGKINTPGTTDETEANSNAEGGKRCITTATDIEALHSPKNEKTVDTSKTDNTTENNEQNTELKSECKQEVSQETSNGSNGEDTTEITNNTDNKNIKGSELEPIMEDTEDKIVKTDTDNLSDKSDADKIKENLKESGRATPTRSSSRLANATPSTIRTRRASRLLQNN